MRVKLKLGLLVAASISVLAVCAHGQPNWTSTTNFAMAKTIMYLEIASQECHSPFVTEFMESKYNFAVSHYSRSQRDFVIDAARQSFDGSASQHGSHEACQEAQRLLFDFANLR